MGIKMRWYFYLITLLLLPCVSATINITPVDYGCDYIRWNWTPGIDVSEIYIDGTAICGYETTENTTLITGFNPGEIHRIDITTPTDSGFNITDTSSLLSCAISGGGGGASGDASAYIILGIIAALILSVLYLRRREE